jgi:hypothetical protein
MAVLKDSPLIISLLDFHQMQLFCSVAADLYAIYTVKSRNKLFEFFRKSAILRKNATHQYVLLGQQVMTVEVTPGTFSADTPFWTAQ